MHDARSSMQDAQLPRVPTAADFGRRKLYNILDADCIEFAAAMDGLFFRMPPGSWPGETTWLARVSGVHADGLVECVLWGPHGETCQFECAYRAQVWIPAIQHTLSENSLKGDCIHSLRRCQASVLSAFFPDPKVREGVVKTLASFRAGDPVLQALLYDSPLWASFAGFATPPALCTGLGRVE